SWFNEFIWSMETNLTPEDVYWGAMLAAVEMIESGVTTVADHYFSMDSVAEAIVQSGMRGHLAPTMVGQGDSRAELEMATPSAQLGLMDVPLLCAHAVHATPEEIELLAEHRAGVAHCPKTFLKLAAGIAPVVTMRARGVAIGVGSDGAASNNTLDMLEQLRL